MKQKPLLQYRDLGWKLVLRISGSGAAESCGPFNHSAWALGNVPSEKFAESFAVMQRMGQFLNLTVERIRADFEKARNGPLDIP